MASSSSSAPQWRYDVFLSFRGPDTRKSITSELYDQLHNKRGIKTFMDDPDLQIGDAISPTLLSAIEESRFAIVILSKDYASSTWCLEELTKLCQCMKGSNRILPVFYDVAPTDVRHQTGSFGEAFNKHGQHEKVQQWRKDLNTVANLEGWSRNPKFKSDKELVETIVEDVCTRVGSVEIKTGDFEIFAATRRAMDDVMKALKDDRVTAIGVYGMGGVGKTTMVEHIGAQACKKGMFDHVIMAKVSQSPDRRNIQGTYADLMRIKLVGETEKGRASELNEQFLRKNKALIIVDDVWDGIDLSSIGIPNPEELQRCKSKVLLTTRVTGNCRKMGCQKQIFLDTLSTNDSWTLFVRNAPRSFEYKEFEKVARRVAGECGGLPIALITVAKALGDKDLEEWEKAARRLEKSQTANPDDGGETFKCIKLSYDYLKNEDYKSCFLLCCLFPEDYDIPLEDLFRYAFGKGLFRGVDTIEEARGTTVSVAKHLKDCSLLLDSKEKECVRMHDVIRDTAIEIANSKGYFVKARCGLKDWQAQAAQERDFVVSLMKNDICKLPKQLVCPKLQLLLLPGNYNLNKIPKDFFQSLNELSVLDLSDCSFSLLPQSFSLLTNLQALCLNCCKNVMNTSILGNLKKLEILSMREYPCKKLSAEIGQLTNLRMLDVSGGRGIVTIPSKVLSKLHRLEELYMLDSGFKHWGSSFEARTIGIASCCPKWGGGIETNIGLDELVGLPNLTILQVDIANAMCIPEKVDVKPNWVDFDIRIGVSSIDTSQFGTFDSRTNHNSKCLHLGGTTIAKLPDWFVNTVTEKTEVLQYSYCRGLSNILMEFDHGRLNELKCLYVNGKDFSDNLVVLMSSRARIKTEPVFKNLEELHLNELDSLKELCVGELPPESLSNLHVLDVKFCTKLENVSKFLQRLPNLETLHLRWNHVIQYVFINTGFQPSKLREMYLSGLKALRSICNGSIQHPMFQNLNILVIYQCMSLQSVFTSDVAECLSLEDLFVEKCHKLKYVIEARKDAATNKKVILPKLKSLVLNELPVLCCVSAIAVDLECPSLEHLYVKKCPSFSVPASSQFQSKNQVQLNDKANYDRLWGRV